MNQHPDHEPAETIRHRRVETAAAVLAIFRTVSNRQVMRIAIEGAPNLTFPFESLGRLLRTRPQIGQRLLQLSLRGFQPDDAARLIEFVCDHFPNLFLFYYTHTEMCPLDYLLTQMARLQFLTNVQLVIRERDLNAELVRRHQPFILVDTLALPNSHANMDIFAFLPQLFPNLVHLYVPCGTIQFRDELLARVGVLFPRLTSLRVTYPQVENGELIGMVARNYEF